MASFLNRVVLIGTVNRQPEMKQLSGSEVSCCFGLTVKTQQMGIRGTPVDEICYLEVEVPGQLGQYASATFGQGAEVFISGRLRYVAWQDQMTGRRKNTIVVRAEQIEPAESEHGVIPQEPAGLSSGAPVEDGMMNGDMPSGDPMSSPF